MRDEESPSPLVWALFPLHLITNSESPAQYGDHRKVEPCKESAGFPRTEARVHSCREPHASGQAGIVNSFLRAEILAPRHRTISRHSMTVRRRARELLPELLLDLCASTWELARCLASLPAPRRSSMGPSSLHYVSPSAFMQDREAG